MNREQFFHIYGNTFNAGISIELAECIFGSFDQDKDGYISFKELMVTLSMTTQGSTEEKLKWLFNVYDQNGDGRISFEEVQCIVDVMQRTMLKNDNKRKNNSIE